jgi:hypothetical protein
MLQSRDLSLLPLCRTRHQQVLANYDAEGNTAILNPTSQSTEASSSWVPGRPTKIMNFSYKFLAQIHYTSSHKNKNGKTAEVAYADNHLLTI